MKNPKPQIIRSRSLRWLVRISGLVSVSVLVALITAILLDVWRPLEKDGPKIEIIGASSIEEATAKPSDAGRSAQSSDEVDCGQDLLCIARQHIALTPFDVDKFQDELSARRQPLTEYWMRGPEDTSELDQEVSFINYMLMVEQMTMLKSSQSLPDSCRISGWGSYELGGDFVRHDSLSAGRSRHSYIEYVFALINSSREPLIADMLVLEVLEPSYKTAGPFDLAWNVSESADKKVDGRIIHADLELRLLNLSGRDAENIRGTIEYKTELCEPWMPKSMDLGENIPESFNSFLVCCAFAPDGELRSNAFTHIISPIQLDSNESESISIKEFEHIAPYVRHNLAGNVSGACEASVLVTLDFIITAEVDGLDETRAGKMQVERTPTYCGDGDGENLVIDFESLAPGEIRILKHSISIAPNDVRDIRLSLDQAFDGMFRFRLLAYRNGDVIATSDPQGVWLGPPKKLDLVSDGEIYSGRRVIGARLSVEPFGDWQRDQTDDLPRVAPVELR